MQSVCWEKWGGGLRQAPLPGLLRGWSSLPLSRAEETQCPVQTAEMDGWTDRIRCGRTLGSATQKHFGSSSNDLSLKTAAPGLNGVCQVLGPQAWPGTFLPRPALLPSIYSRKSYVGGARARLKRRKRERQGREQGWLG